MEGSVVAWDTNLDKDSIAYKIAAAKGVHVRVVAGPGTGKSFAMKRRVARLLEENVAPKKILAVTFTRVAAEDLHRELQKLDTPGCDELEGQTLHSLGMRILSRKHALEALGRVSRTLNRFEQATLISDLADHHGGRKKCKKLIEAYEAAWAQSQGDQPGFPNTDEERKFEKDLLSWLKFHRGMLIGEIIPYLVRYLKENPQANEHNEYQHILVDEYQDLNKAEQTAIGYLAANGSICIVGDDDQSIYSFKKAHPEGIREWPKTHPECTNLEMDDCYRCPTSIVDMANELIAHNTNRDDRKLKAIAKNGPGEIEIVQSLNPAEEAEWITSKILTLLKSGVHEHEIIVLVQRSKMARAILDTLKQAGIRAKSYYEESQLESEAAQERFALLKLLLNRDDRVALRYLVGKGSPNRRSKAYKKLRAHCEITGESPWVALEKLNSGELTISYLKQLVAEYSEIRKRLDELEDAKNDLPKLVDALFPEGTAELAELRELALSLMGASKDVQELFGGMLKEITQPDIPPAVEDVRVMSLHKSKGLSSPYVFIAGCVQGILPQAADDDIPIAEQDAALEEARRLMFVGITRVKSQLPARPGTLCISFPKEMNAGKASGAKISFSFVQFGLAQLLPSQFLKELGKQAPAPKKV